MKVYCTTAKASYPSHLNPFPDTSTCTSGWFVEAVSATVAVIIVEPTERYLNDSTIRITTCGDVAAPSCN
jgi:hypothetical protein